MRSNEKLTSNIDWTLLICYMLLLTIGIATVYSVAYNENHPSIFDFSQKYGKQIAWLSVATFLGFLVFLIDSQIYKKFSLIIYFICIFLLVLVLFMPAINGAHAWLGFGSLGIQPAEFAKIGTAVLLARYITEINVKIQTVRSVLIANAIIMVPMALVLMQPDAGTFVVFTSFLFVMYREGITYDPIVLKLVNLLPGVKFKETWFGTQFIPVIFVLVLLSVITLLVSGNENSTFGFFGQQLPGLYMILFVLFCLSVVSFLAMRFVIGRANRRSAIVISIFIFLISSGISLAVHFGFSSLATHQKQRIELFLGLKEDPDREDYNRNRAMAAVGSGGFLGKGYKQASLSSVESNHVPESETDFIFTSFAEEWGFAGSLVLVALYFIMLMRVITIAERQKSTFNRVYAYCVAMIVFYHFAVNIGMNIGFAPVIGIPLPFLSYGGSSTMSFSIFIFILLKLDSQRNQGLF